MRHLIIIILSLFAISCADNVIERDKPLEEKLFLVFNSTSSDYTVHFYVDNSYKEIGVVSGEHRVEINKNAEWVHGELSCSNNSSTSVRLQNEYGYDMKLSVVTCYPDKGHKFNFIIE